MSFLNNDVFGKPRLDNKRTRKIRARFVRNGLLCLMNTSIQAIIFLSDDETYLRGTDSKIMQYNDNKYLKNLIVWNI